MQYYRLQDNLQKEKKKKIQDNRVYKLNKCMF